MSETICADCGSKLVYKIEFRTDYTNASSISITNKDIPNIYNEDLPYRLSGYYCDDCESFCSVTTKEEG